MSFFEYKMTELDRVVLAINAANSNRAAQRLRSLTAALDPKPAPKESDVDGDDLLFDNVPI